MSTLQNQTSLLRKRVFELFLEIVKAIYNQARLFEEAMQRLAEVIVEYIQEEEGENNEKDN